MDENRNPETPAESNIGAGRWNSWNWKPTHDFFIANIYDYIFNSKWCFEIGMHMDLNKNKRGILSHWEWQSSMVNPFGYLFGVAYFQINPVDTEPKKISVVFCMIGWWGVPTMDYDQRSYFSRVFLFGLKSSTDHLWSNTSCVFDGNTPVTDSKLLEFGVHPPPIESPAKCFGSIKMTWGPGHGGHFLLYIYNSITGKGLSLIIGSVKLLHTIN